MGRHTDGGHVHVSAHAHTHACTRDQEEEVRTEPERREGGRHVA